MTVVESVTLFCTEGTSDKEYRAQLSDLGNGTFRVDGFNGRRGTALKPQPKGQFDSLQAAKDVYAKLVKSKIKGGYKPDANADTADTTMTLVRERADTGLRPHLLTPVEIDVLERCIKNPRYGFEQKHDGERLMVERIGDRLAPSNRQGVATSIPKSLEDALLALPGNFVVDGEIVGDQYYVFDIMERDGQNIRQHGYESRYDVLSTLLAGARPNLHLVILARTEAEKRAMFERLKDINAEGVVIIALDSPYIEGRNEDRMKFKFWVTASCIISAHNDKRSVALHLLAETGDAIAVGNVTIPANHEIPLVGDVVEIRYLYMVAEGGSLYQPTYLGRRTDIPHTDCLVSQIKYKSAEAA